ncbi:sugar phosphate isomerase/epimerase [bacterium]|nr:sugar phosphate isomerase/epimerase [candidate division CSSED10-310 bacterium]
MKYLICGRGKPEERDIIPRLLQLDIGMELQSYGLEGIVSEQEWKTRFQSHRQFRDDFPGLLVVHGPFIGVSYCHPDHLFRQAVQQRLDMTREVSIRLDADTLVMHSGLSSDVEKFNIMDDWIKETVSFWKREIPRYAEAGVSVVLENIVDDNPVFLKNVIDQVDHPNLKICLDTGHVNVWSSISLDEWLEELGTRIAHVHLHNNDGRKDQHAGLDGGTMNLRHSLKRIAKDLPETTISLEMLLSPQQLIETVQTARSITG